MTSILGGVAANENAKGLIWTFGLLAFVFFNSTGSAR
jgi:hypothetical protein